MRASVYYDEFYDMLLIYLYSETLDTYMPYDGNYYVKFQGDLNKRLTFIGYL